MKTLATLSFIVLFLAGCGGAEVKPKSNSLHSLLDKKKVVLISTPADGSFATKPYVGSGAIAADAIKKAFAKIGVTAVVTDQCHAATCFALDDIKKYGYYLRPEIVQWEDRETEWTGMPDKVEIQITIYDLETRAVVGLHSYAERSSKWVKPGHLPQDLLAKPTRAYIKSLYRK